jgi:hypothetical protein
MFVLLLYSFKREMLIFLCDNYTLYNAFVSQHAFHCNLCLIKFLGIVFQHAFHCNLWLITFLGILSAYIRKHTVDISTLTLCFGRHILIFTKGWLPLLENLGDFS